MSYPSHQTVQGRLTQAVLNSPGKWAGSPFYWCDFFLHGLPAILTHWGRVTHISVRNLTIIGSDNGLSPGRRQAIIWTNGGILLIGHLGTNFNEQFIEIQTFSFKKMHLKRSSAKWRPFCLCLNVLTLLKLEMEYSSLFDEYHACWCPGS